MVSAAVNVNLIFVCCLALQFFFVAANAADDGTNNYLDVETPNFFNYNSPLRQPDSLRNRPYFDFLSTLYRRDTGKSDLFRPYLRTRRDVPVPIPVITSDTASKTSSATNFRTKRAHVFRPLFVYKQQQIKKQEIQAKRKRI